MRMYRFGTITKIKNDKLEAYIDLHNHIPEEVVAAAAKYGLRNFSIFYFDGYLFSYFEYCGEDYSSDMEEKAKLPFMKQWKESCDQCFERIDGKEDYSIILQEIFHNSFQADDK